MYRRYGFGGMTPSSGASGGTGGLSSGASLGIGLGGNLLASVLDSTEGENVNVASRTASGALRGAAAGAMFGPVGIGVGAGVGLIGGLITGNKAKKEQDAALKAERERLAKERKQNSIYRNSQINQNIMGVDYFGAYGTKVKGSRLALGGKLSPMGSGDSEVVGDKHGEDSNNDGLGGVTLLDKEGNPIAEVEDGEVKHNDLVFSDRLPYRQGTFASEAKSLMLEKEKLETGLSKEGLIGKNKAARSISKINKKLQVMFEEQTRARGEQEEQYRKAEGGTINRDTIAGGAAVLDNVVNAFLTANKPKVPEPELLKAAPLQTKVNIQPQLNAISDFEDNFEKSIDANTSNSAIGNIMKLAGRTRGLTARNDAIGTKINREVDLTNQDALNRQSVEGVNVGIKNNNNLLKYQRKNDIQSDISANFANLSDDIQLTVKQLNQQDLDAEKMSLLKKQLEVLKEKYKGTGVYDRNIEALLAQYLEGTGGGTKPVTGSYNSSRTSVLSKRINPFGDSLNATIN